MRLHPLSIPYRALEGGGQVIAGIVIASFAGAGSLEGPSSALVFGIIFLVGVVVALGWQLAYYRRFEYRLTEDTFDIDSGVLSRREREIPYGRIQNVDIKQNVVQRVLSIAQVSIETAGGGQTEAELKYVATEEANRLQSELSRRKRSSAAESEGTEEPEQPEATTLFEISSRELAVLGVVSMDPRLLSLLAFPLSFVGPSAIEPYIPSLELLVLVVPLVVVGTLLVTAAVSGVLAITRYYDFELRATDDEYRYERGLLQRFSGSIPKTKVQTLTLTENVIARRLGYASLTIETAGSVVTQNGGSTSQSAIPIAQRERVVDLARHIEPFEDLTFERPPKRARQRYAARYSIVVGILTLLAYAAAALTPLSGPWFAVAGLFVLVPPAAHLKWKHRGYRVEDDHVITRNGFWTRQISVVPAYRIQTVVSSATIFQRRRNLATVVVDTAGGSRLTGNDAKAVDIDAAVAEEMREELAEDLQRALGSARAQRRGRDHTETPV